MPDIDDGEVHFIGEDPINLRKEKPDVVVNIETPGMDKVVGGVKESACKALDTERLESILDLGEIMYNLKRLYNSPAAMGKGDGASQKMCRDKIMELEDRILAYKQFLTKDKVYSLYKNGSENFVVNNLDELECFLSENLAYDMIKGGYAHLVMPRLKKFGLSFNIFFVDKLIEFKKGDVIVDYIEYADAEPHQLAEFVVRIIEAGYSDRIGPKLWKLKGLDIEETIGVMLDEGVDPKKIREWMIGYIAHMEKGNN